MREVKRRTFQCFGEWNQLMEERSSPGWSGCVGGESRVQGWGRVDGLPWYFRARGAAWSLEIVDDESIDPQQLPIVGEVSGWLIEEDYGVSPQASYMASSAAWSLIEKCIEKFRAGELPYWPPE